jgi:TolB protein
MKAVLLALALAPLSAQAPAAPPVLHDAQEVHLANVKQLTTVGGNAEAYWAPNGKSIVFQSTRDGRECDQIYVMNPDGSGQRRVSTGAGRCTCGWVLPSGRILFASTHGAGADCPQAPPFTPGVYRWPVFPGYDLYTVKPDGTDLKALAPSPGYDAEATVSPNGKWIVFTSERSGDVDLWRMDADGTHLIQLTDRVGYDGGGVFSPDSTKIAWRTNYPVGDEGIAKYKTLLKDHLVEPMQMDIWVMDADGKNKRQVTHLPGAAFAPIFTPDGKALVFASNHHDNNGKGRSFDLFKVNLDGTGLERLTFTGTFNSFPHFSPDGKRLLWVSGRVMNGPRLFNVFVADWLK